jgi:hypothetical protein
LYRLEDPTEIFRAAPALGTGSPFRYLVENLEDGNAFVKMLQEIVAADPSDYDSLVGKAYPDHFTTGHGGERPMPGPDSEGPRPWEPCCPNGGSSKRMTLTGAFIFSPADLCCIFFRNAEAP